MNTAIIHTLPIHVAANIAEYHAKAALRAGRQQGRDSEDYAVHQNKMFDVLEAARYPRLTTQELVRHVGRSKAMVLKIDRPLINLALADQ